MFICFGEEIYIGGRGSTLENAFKDYVDQGGGSRMEDCDYFTAEKIAVEVKIVPVQVIVKAWSK